jgi:hypothetical protein
MEGAALDDDSIPTLPPLCVADDPDPLIVPVSKRTSVIGSTAFGGEDDLLDVILHADDASDAQTGGDGDLLGDLFMSSVLLNEADTNSTDFAAHLSVPSEATQTSPPEYGGERKRLRKNDDASSNGRHPSATFDAGAFDAAAEAGVGRGQFIQAGSSATFKTEPSEGRSPSDMTLDDVINYPSQRGASGVQSTQRGSSAPVYFESASSARNFKVVTEGSTRSRNEDGGGQRQVYGNAVVGSGWSLAASNSPPDTHMEWDITHPPQQSSTDMGGGYGGGGGGGQAYPQVDYQNGPNTSYHHHDPQGHYSHHQSGYQQNEQQQHHPNYSPPQQEVHYNNHYHHDTITTHPSAAPRLSFLPSLIPFFLPSFLDIRPSSFLDLRPSFLPSFLPSLVSPLPS